MTAPTLIRKTAPIEIKAISEAEGIVTAYVNSLEVVDHDQEVLASGAFDASIKASLPAVAWMHDPRTIVGGVTAAREERRRLLATMQFDLDTEPGAYAFKMVARGRVKEWSVGFYATDWKMEERDGKSVRVINAVEWVEVSPVLKGASPNTATAAVKHVVDAPAEVCEACGVAYELDIGDAACPADPGAHVWVTLATWTAAFINDLPDSAFAVVLPGGEKDEDGKTVPRSLRKLPHHGQGGGIDLPHLRNALARLPQADLPDAARASAQRHLNGHASAEGVGDAAKGDLYAEGLRVLYEQQRRHLTEDLGVDLPELVPKVGARNAAADLKRLQAMHDMAVELGATCMSE